MLSWLELDEQFRDVAPTMQHARIDYQWGVAGTHYNLMSGGADLNRFVALARIAGKKLSELPANELHADIMTRERPEERWYEALRHYSNVFQHGVFGEQHVDGTLQGHIFTGTINAPATPSANVALYFSAAAATPSATLVLPVPPAQPFVIGAINAWLQNEREKRGTFWLVVGSVLALLLAALALPWLA